MTSELSVSVLLSARSKPASGSGAQVGVERERARRGGGLQPGDVGAPVDQAARDGVVAVGGAGDLPVAEPGIERGAERISRGPAIDRERIVLAEGAQHGVVGVPPGGGQQHGVEALAAAANRCARTRR